MIVPIVFGVDGNFAIPLQVAIVSLMENRAGGTEYDIYVMHSDNYGLDDRLRLKKVFERYGSGKLTFFPMGNAYAHAAVSYPAMTKATFYRLSIHKIVPDRYGQCIYCDSDTIINCDLGSLFQIELMENYLAGAADPVIRYSGKREEFSDLSGYINAGVLVINLKKWREAAIENQFEQYILRRLKYHDQDILNLVCGQRILLFKEDKYVVSGVLNRRKHGEIRSAIVHYCGLIKPWDIAVDSPYFNLWLYYAERASVDVEKLRLEERRKRFDGFLRKKGIHNVMVWGMSASTLDICFFLEELGLKILGIGDNNTEKVRQGNEYYEMIDAESISGNGQDVYCIVNSVNYYDDIRKQLVCRGMTADNIISWQECKCLMVSGEKEREIHGIG